MKRDAAEESSRTKAVVSSAYKLSLVILFPFSRPLMEFVVLIWCASGSTTRTKSKPERGHPCLTPLCKEKNSDECPLLMTQLEILL